MAAGDIIQTKSGTVVNATQIVLTFDSTVTSGNDIVLLVGHGSDGITTPTGYTLVKTQEHATNNQWGGIYRKKSNGTETGVTVNFAATEEGGVFMMEVEGMASSPDDKTNGSYNATSQSSIAPGSTGTLSQANEFVVCIGWNWNGNEDWTINDGFSHYEIDAGSSYHALIGYVVVSATTAKNPTITFEGNCGAWSVALIASFKLSVEQTITPGLKQQLVTTFSPVVTPGSVDITPVLKQQLAVAFDPTFTTGVVYVTPEVKQQLVAAFSPGFTQTAPTQYITPAVVQQLVGAYDPEFSRDIIPGLVVIDTLAFTPTITAVTDIVLSSCVTLETAAFDPTLTVGTVIISPDLVQNLIAGFSPDITLGLELVPVTMVQLATAFDPTFTTGPISFTPSLVEFLVAAYDPEIRSVFSIYPTTVVQAIQSYDPTIVAGAVNLEPEQAQQLIQAFAPALVGLIDPPLVEQLVVAFSPEVIRLLSVVEPDIVQQLAVTFVPALFIEGSFAGAVGFLYITNSYDPQTHVDESYHPETFVTGDSETYIRRR